DNINDGDDSSYFYGVEVRYPILNRRARGVARRASSQLEQADLRIRRFEQSILTQIRSAVRELRTAQESIVASQAQVEAARESMIAERRRLEVGDSTTFRVLELQESFSRAQLNELQALIAYQNGLINLER